MAGVCMWSLQWAEKLPVAWLLFDVYGPNALGMVWRVLCWPQIPNKQRCPLAACWPSSIAFQPFLFPTRVRFDQQWTGVKTKSFSFFYARLQWTLDTFLTVFSLESEPRVRCLVKAKEQKTTSCDLAYLLQCMRPPKVWLAQYLLPDSDQKQLPTESGR